MGKTEKELDAEDLALSFQNALDKWLISRRFIKYSDDTIKLTKAILEQVAQDFVYDANGVNSRKILERTR